MIDGVKLLFRSATIVSDLQALGAEVYDVVARDTGELKKHTAEYNTLKFDVFPSNTVLITGSLHKYSKGENFSNFTFIELCECINDLAEKFHFTPCDVRIQNLEFGVNISPPFNPFDFCNAVITHKGETFRKMQSKGLHVGFECERRQYTVKIYDKGKQYFKNENILRFEVKTHKMVFIERTRISVLSDLTDIARLNELGVILNEVFSELIISDTVNKHTLTKNELHIYNQCTNPKTWERFTRQERNRKKNQFKKIIQTHGKNQWFATSAKMISDKWKMLMALKK